MLQRDVFLEEINFQLNKDKDIYVMSADFGAAALDNIREEFKDNFIHCGKPLCFPWDKSNRIFTCFHT